MQSDDHKGCQQANSAAYLKQYLLFGSLAAAQQAENTTLTCYHLESSYGVRYGARQHFLITHPADTQQHYHSFVISFVATRWQLCFWYPASLFPSPLFGADAGRHSGFFCTMSFSVKHSCQVLLEMTLMREQTLNRRGQLRAIKPTVKWKDTKRLYGAEVSHRVRWHVISVSQRGNIFHTIRSYLTHRMQKQPKLVYDSSLH